MLIEPRAIEQAASAIRRWLVPTPLVRSHWLSRKLGSNVYLKLETLQPTHSFKVRGACNALSNLPEDRRANGVITASGGNHGLAIAWAAATLGIPATVLLPKNSPADRVQSIRSLRANVVLHGESWDEANVRAKEIAKTERMSYVHPFDNVDVMAGQGTIVCELVEQLPRIDVMVASIGGGGLLSGLISAAKAFSPGTRFVGVETEGADSMYQSWQAGEIVELPAITSIAETLGARKTEQRQFEIITRYASGLVTVTDEQAVTAMANLLGEEKLLTEPATACSLAALLSGKIPVDHAQNVVVVLCGANVGVERLRNWLAALRA